MTTAGPTVYQHLPGAGGAHSPQLERHADRLVEGLATVADGGAAATAIAFGPFRLLPAQRLLLEGDEPVRLGSRALEILIALVERAGELVGKNELVARVWPNTFVEEGNLKVQVAGLRRALGDRRGSNRYLATVPGRGYRFVAPITLSETPRPLAPAAAAARAHNLPVPMTRMINRADSVAALTAQLPRERFITIVGPGGIGKTTVALAVAGGLLEAYEHGVRFVDLADFGDPHHVPSALAAVLRLEARPDPSIPGLIAVLKNKQMLLVLDNCEHVIEAAAALAALVLQGAPGVQILATSREPLRAEGEQVHRLPVLGLPPPSAGLTAAEALHFPAVQLFVERAAAILGAFNLGDRDAPMVADICRKLDGIPLAIELAAARIDAFGVRGLATHLDDLLPLLTGARRPALARHQTMRASLDWGHELLPEPERVILRRLAIFSGGFTLEAASAVAASAEITAADVVECVANLVAKSLIAADVGGALPSYRLLETTRTYALEKLSRSGELEQVERRQAEYTRPAVQPTDAGWSAPPGAARLAPRGRWIHDGDAARDRAPSPTGDASIGAALSVRPMPAWFYL